MKLLPAALLFLAAAPVAAEPAMWRVHDADTEIVLMGSMHALPADTAWLSPRIAARVDAADVLVLEAVLPDDPSVVAGLVSRLGYKPGEPKLAQRVTPKRRDKLTAALRTAAVSVDTLDPMETWLAAIVISDAILAKLGLTAKNGVEAVLTARVRAADKPVTPLETLEQQFGYFDSLPEPDQRAMLDATIDDVTTARADTDRLVRAWSSGNTTAIAEEFRRDAFASTPIVIRVLLRERNARWADWIKARLRQPGKVFIAVGAAHLAGPESVQAMLAARGVQAERLP